VERPSIYKSPMFIPLVGGFLLTAAYVAYKVGRRAAWLGSPVHARLPKPRRSPALPDPQLYLTSLIRHPLPWAVLSMGVFWFSASGGM
jgi:oligosaccharyltransferase complex subunit gamma